MALPGLFPVLSLLGRLVETRCSCRRGGPPALFHRGTRRLLESCPSNVVLNCRFILPPQEVRMADTGRDRRVQCLCAMVRGHRFVQQTAVPQYLDQTREGFGLLSTLSQPLEETYHGFPRLSAIGLQLRIETVRAREAGVMLFEKTPILQALQPHDSQD